MKKATSKITPSQITKAYAKTLTLKDLGETLKSTKSEIIFTELYNRTKNGMINYIFNIVKDKSHAKDLHTEVMVAVAKKIDLYNTKYHITTWMYRIAYTHACYHLRHTKDKITTPLSKFQDGEYSKLDGVLFRLEDTQGSSQEEYETGQAMLLKAAKELPLEYRQAIAYKYFEDMKIEDIAKKMKISVAKTKNLLNRGKAKLAESLKDTNIKQLMYS